MPRQGSEAIRSCLENLLRRAMKPITLLYFSNNPSGVFSWNYTNDHTKFSVMANEYLKDSFIFIDVFHVSH